MNFYKRHIGDYVKDTAHLSLLEHGIYARLLDVYYTRERALPAFDATARLIGARSDEERSALRDVLNEFFTAEPDGFSHARCEREIAVASEAAARAREVGKKGGRPKKFETPQVPTENPAGYFPEPTDNPSQTPDSRLQTPDSRQGQKSRERAPTGTRLPAVPLPDEYADFCRQERPDLVPAEAWDRFSDYWQAKPGKDGVKLDWLATWRNWVRSERRQAPARASPTVAVGKYANVMAELTGKSANPAPKEFIDVDSRTITGLLD